MQVTETKAEGLKHGFKVVVPAETIAAKVTDKIKSIGENATIPGFRKGKAPESFLRQRYEKAVMGEVLDELIQSETSQLLAERSLRPAMRPKIEIILNIDSDHLDYFKDIDHIANSFHRFADLVPSSGTLIAYDANPFVQAVIESVDCNVITFGFGHSCTYYADNIKFNSMGMPSFDVYCPDGLFGSVQLSVPGEHNITNSLAAIACCHSLGVSAQSIIDTLVHYTGTQRRFDVIGSTKNNVRIVDDYAHHPTEIKATLAAANKMAHNKLWCLFQPHTYTRTMALFDEFAEAFHDADKLIFAEIYAAREKNIYKISSKSLVTEIKKRHPEKDVYFFDDFSDMASFVYNNADEGDLVLTMGAGDIYRVAELILELDQK